MTPRQPGGEEGSTGRPRGDGREMGETETRTLDVSAETLGGRSDVVRRGRCVGVGVGVVAVEKARRTEER